LLNKPKITTAKVL